MEGDKCTQQSSADNNSPRTPPCDEEDFEFGRFFDKLASLVPTVSCAYDSQVICQEEDSTPHQSLHNINNNQTLSKKLGILNNNKNVNKPCVNSECISSNMNNNNNNCNYINNLNSSSSDNKTEEFVSVDHSSWPQKHCKSNNKSSNALKVCRTNRQRPSPYSVTINNTGTSGNHSGTSRYTRCNRNNGDLPQARRNRHTSEEQIETNSRLDLLTDVIEYINNLKSLLQSAQSTQFDGSNSNRLNADQSETHLRLQQQHNSTSKTHATEIPSNNLNSIINNNFNNVTRTTSDMGASSHQALLSSGPQPTGVAVGCSLAPTGVGAAGPVDRAMELLEYKTGAITLTA